MTPRCSILLAACGGLAMVAGAARADEPPPPAPPAAGSPQDEATERLRIGLTCYQEHDYERAIEEFRVGFSLDPRREFLFALGQAERLSGDCGSAILYYQAFVRSRPSAGQASAAREQIQICHLMLATEPPRRPSTDPGRSPGTGLPRTRIERDEPPPLPRAARAVPAPARGQVTDLAPWYTDITGDVLLGGGVVMLALGGGLWAASSSAATAAAGAPTYPEYDALIDRARTRRTLALTAGAAGGALVGAAIWRFRWGRGRGAGTRIALAPAPGQVSFAFGGQF